MGEKMLFSIAIASSIQSRQIHMNDSEEYQTFIFFNPRHLWTLFLLLYPKKVSSLFFPSFKHHHHHSLPNQLLLPNITPTSPSCYTPNPYPLYSISTESNFSPHEYTDAHQVQTQSSHISFKHSNDYPRISSSNGNKEWGKVLKLDLQSSSCR